MAKRFSVPQGLFRFDEFMPAFDVPGDATDAEIAPTEKALGVKLPRAYVAVLKVRNGGLLRLNRFKLKGDAKKQLDRKYVPVGGIPGVHPTDGHALSQIAALAKHEWEVPDGLVAFDGDGHTWVCLDYRESGPDGEPRVTYLDLEEEQECVLAETFEVFLKGLYRDAESLSPALIALDSVARKPAEIGKVLLDLGFVEHQFEGYANPNFPRPPTWTWSKYNGRIQGWNACVQFERNKLYPVSLQKTPKRSANHPMLTVSVCDEHEEACLADLLAALGAGAVLLERSR